MEKTIFMTVLSVTFLQILHIFEEITLGAYTLYKKSNPKGYYLRVASFLVFMNFIVLGTLYFNFSFAYFIAFYSVIISIGNTFSHILLIIKQKKKLGYGFPSSVPFGISGLVLLIMLLKYLIWK